MRLFIAKWTVMVVDGEFPMEFSQSVSPRYGCLLRALEVFAPHRLAIEVYAAFPFTVMLAVAHADVSARIIRLFRSVEHVLGVGSLAKIIPLVLRWPAISVVDFAFWPLAGFNQPCEPMGKVEVALKANRNASIPEPPGGLTRELRVPILGSIRAIAPSNDASLLVILEDFARSLGRKGFISLHLVMLLFWQTRHDLASIQHNFNYRSA